MTSSTILVSLNDVVRAEAMIKAAALLATAMDAHVIGSYVIPAVTIFPAAGYAIPPAVDDSHQKFYTTHMPAIREKFEAMLKREGLSGEWRSAASQSIEISQTLVAQACAVDLVLVSQVDDESPANTLSGLVEHLVMESGRPVLIVPQLAPFAVPKTVVVGFNDTRESGRALFDSLPLLKLAADVRVVWVNPYKESEQAGSIPAAEAAIMLARHGIKATAEGQMADGSNTGTALLQKVDDVGAGLLVIGGYGHSRMREYIFGGTTRHILLHANIPVLMSH